MKRSWKQVSGRISRVLLCSLIAAVLVPIPATAIEPPPEPMTLYVNVAFEGEADGSVTAPFPTITQALDWADSGDTIIVASGTYSWDTGEDFPLFIEQGVALKAPAGPDLTIIDAMLEDTAIVCGFWDARDVSDESVPASLEIGAPILVEGFTVQNGSMEIGGNIYVNGPTPVTLRDLKIESGVAWIGSGLFAADADVRVESCEFTGNGWRLEPLFGPTVEPPSDPSLRQVVTTAGGAVFVDASTVTFTDTAFTDNAAMFEGGALYAGFSDVTMSDCSATDNYVSGDNIFRPQKLVPQREGSNGGFAHLSVTQAVISDLLASGNVASVGGVISSDDASGIEIVDSVFSGNEAYTGAVMYRGRMVGDASAAPGYAPETQNVAVRPTYYAGTTLFERCEFRENSALDVATLLIEGQLHVLDSVFADNYDEGATLAAMNGSTVEGSTFVGNMTNIAVLGSPGDIFFGQPEEFDPGFVEENYLVNSIIWGNEITGGLPGGELNTLSPLGDAFIGDAIRFWYAVNSDVQGSFEGTMSISTDPMFADPEAGDYRLDVGSPCIDTGTWDTSSYVDLDGLLRPVDGNLDGSEDYDMGAYESAGPRMDRLAGETRYETSADVSADRFAFADTVVIATGRVFADGLSAAGLAGAYEAPLLLTASDYLPLVIADEIERLGAESAIVVGGTAAVDGGVVSALEGMGLEVTRIGGGDRYETAALVAEEIRSVMGEGMSEVAFVARGDQYPDALAVSPVAYALGAPILLVRPDSLPDATIDVIADMGIQSVVVAGGSNAVGVSVAGDIAAEVTAIERISGSNRYETAALFAEYAVEQGWAQYTVTGLATGASFPDALSGGAALGHINGVMLLTPADVLSSFTADVLTARAEEIIYLRTLGGSAAVSAEVQAAAEALVE